MNSLSDILSSKSKDLFDGDDLIANTSDDSNGGKKKDRKQTAGDEIDIASLKSIVYNIKDQLDNVIRILNNKETVRQKNLNPEQIMLEDGERIVEGVFTGDKMMGQDGKEYSVPPNYASKSKLVEGDIMKLTITANGSFIFKQIQPVERKRVTGELVSDGNGQWSVLADGKTYKILTASATFFKAKAGDEAVILVPDDGESEWGAVENIINKTM